MCSLKTNATCGLPSHSDPPKLHLDHHTFRSMDLVALTTASNWHRQSRLDMRATLTQYLNVSPERLRSKQSGTIKLNCNPFPKILKLRSSCSQMVNSDVSSGNCAKLWFVHSDICQLISSAAD